MMLDFEMRINMENKLSALTAVQQESERKSLSVCLASRHVELLGWQIRLEEALEQRRDWTCTRRNYNVGSGQTVASYGPLRSSKPLKFDICRAP